MKNGVTEILEGRKDGGENFHRSCPPAEKGGKGEEIRCVLLDAERGR